MSLTIFENLENWIYILQSDYMAATKSLLSSRNRSSEESLIWKKYNP